MTVSSIPVRKLRMHELVAFSSRVLDMLSMYEAGVYTFIDDFRAKCAAYSASISEVDVSNSLAAADAQNDQVWSGFNHHIKGRCLHLDPSVREAAEAVRGVFDQTDNPTKLSYDEEYGALRTLLERLDALPAEVHAAALTAEWVSMLRQSLDQYAEAAKHQSDVKGSHECGANEKKRAALLLSWNTMRTKLNAMLALELDDKLPAAAGSINAFIGKTNQRLKARLAKKNDDEADINFDSI